MLIEKSKCLRLRIQRTPRPQWSGPQLLPNFAGCLTFLCTFQSQWVEPQRSPNLEVLLHLFWHHLTQNVHVRQGNTSLGRASFLGSATPPRFWVSFTLFESERLNSAHIVRGCFRRSATPSILRGRGPQRTPISGIPPRTHAYTVWHI